ncbi:MAG: type VI secretion system tip protein VgrG [Desulfovibrionaceae bacterium]|nr:type VI secretion system tip protein VgrG [Desulfovibrionaceae bacterium]
MSRTFIAHSALGDKLEFRRLTGDEYMGKPFEFKVDLLSDSDSIDPKALLGTDLTIEIDLTTEAGGGTRYLSGQVTAFRFAGREGDSYLYKAILHPWLSLAAFHTDFKIFQFKTVPDIVQEVLAPYGFIVENRLSYQYRTWDYLVQYGESDFDFVNRLLEHEGAYYYFAHQMGSHKMILADDIGGHTSLPGVSTIPYYPGNRAAHVHDEDYIDGWNATQGIASGKFAADDYDFTKPRALLDTRQNRPAGHSQDSYEVFTWPGGYTEMGDGEQYARVRIEQQKAQRETIHGTGNARNLAPGYLFNLTKYPRADQNQRYLITGASYHFTENVRRSDGGGGDSPTTYRLEIDAVPSTVPWRSKVSTRKPSTTGPQTAVVTGPAGEEIYTDKYGRVKVHFFWDRHGTKDENSSCWIRVNQVWAGAGYGSMHIPRIGQEVIVDFINGDPDYPLITGRVYNDLQMPPWNLPDNKTQSGTKSHSSKGGADGPGLKAGAGDTNVIRMEDMKGSEQLWFHAQKDQLTEVEHDEDKWVGNDRRKTVDGDETNVIHKNRTETVDIDETITIHGNRTEVVDKDETITIHQNRTDTVDMNETRTVHQNRTRTVDQNETVTIHQNRNKTVDNSETDRIGDNWFITVGKFKLENIGMAYMQNVGLAKMVNIGAAYNVNVGAMMMTNVVGNQTTNVLSNRSVTVTKDQTTHIKQNSKTTVDEVKTLKVGKEMAVDVGDAIEIKCGAAVLRMTKDGTVQINGKTINAVGSADVTIASPKTDINPA